MKKRTMITAKEVSKKWFKNPTFHAAYDALENEFAQASKHIEAGIKAGRNKRKARKAYDGAR